MTVYAQLYRVDVIIIRQIDFLLDDFLLDKINDDVFR